MTSYSVQILHGINNNNFETVDKQQFNLYISPLALTRENPTEKLIYDAGSYRTVGLNNLPTIPIIGTKIIQHPYQYLDQVTLRFEDRQCNSKSHQYYVSFIKIIN